MEDALDFDDERTFWTLVLVIAAAMAYRYMPRWRSRSPFLSPREVERRLTEDGDAVVLDVRTPHEFAGRGGHVPGAVNVPLADLGSRLRAHDVDNMREGTREGQIHEGDMEAMKQVALYVCCSAEARAARAARILRDRGFTRVSVVRGGFRAWRRSNLPVESEQR